MIRILVGSAILVMSVFVANGQTSAPTVPRRASFDCIKAKAASARLICADGEIGALDIQLGDAFKRRLGPLVGAARDAAIADQRRWISTRNTQCGLNGKDNAPVEELLSAKACMMVRLKDRISYFGGSAISKTDNQSAAPNVQQLSFSGVKKEVNCKDSTFSGILVFIDPDRTALALAWFMDDAILIKFLDAMREAALVECGRTKANSATTVILGTMLAGSYGISFRADQHGLKPWEIRNFIAQRERERVQQVEYERVQQERLRQIADQQRREAAERQRALMAKRARVDELRTTVLKQIEDGSLKSAKSGEDRVIVEQLSRVLASKGVQVGPGNVQCAEDYDFLGGTVFGRSIDGMVGVFLVDLIVFYKGDGTISPNSIAASVCGNPPRVMQSGEAFIGRWKAQFRKYDTGWQFEGLLQ